MKDKEAYLKCIYSPGQFSNEYFVQFKGSEYPTVPLGGIFVVKENIILDKENKEKGLVKIVVVRRDEKTSQISVPSKTDSGTFFKVLNEDIVLRDN
jgi:hypothetical protein